MRGGLAPALGASLVVEVRMVRQLICCLCLLLVLLPSLPALPLEGDPPTVDQVFDSYHDLDWEDEKARLNNFAHTLLSNPDLVGYILVYAGRRACRGEAIARAERAKRYVVKRGIAADRIITRDGGYRGEVTTYLQPVARGGPAFEMYPTLELGEVELVKKCRNGLPSKSKRG